MSKENITVNFEGVKISGIYYVFIPQEEWEIIRDDNKSIVLRRKQLLI